MENARIRLFSCCLFLKRLDMVQYEINVLMFIVMEHLKRCVSHNASGSDVKDCILHWISDRLVVRTSISDCEFATKALPCFIPSLQK